MLVLRRPKTKKSAGSIRPGSARPGPCVHLVHSTRLRCVWRSIAQVRRSIRTWTLQCAEVWPLAETTQSSTHLNPYSTIIPSTASCSAPPLDSADYIYTGRKDGRMLLRVGDLAALCGVRNTDPRIHVGPRRPALSRPGRRLRDNISAIKPARVIRRIFLRLPALGGVAWYEKFIDGWCRGVGRLIMIAPRIDGYADISAAVEPFFSFDARMEKTSR